MNEKNLRELEYEMEMQEQAEYMSRWKLRKEIKKKLRALRKKIKADEASLPQLQTISRRLDDVEKPLEPCVRSNDEPKLEPYKHIDVHVIHSKPVRLEQHYIYDPHVEMNDLTDYMILEEVCENFGRELLREHAIQYLIKDEDGMRKIEIMIDVVLPDIPRENPAKYVNSPTLPIRKCPG